MICSHCSISVVFKYRELVRVWPHLSFWRPGCVVLAGESPLGAEPWCQLGDWTRTTTICQYMCMCSVFICIHYLSLYYCVTKSPQSLVVYDNKHLSHTVSVNWESDRRLAGYFWLRVSHESIVKCQPGLYSPEGLTGPDPLSMGLTYQLATWCWLLAGGLTF